MIDKIKNSFNKNRTKWITWIVAFLPLIFLAIIFNKIPGEIPYKFDDTGEVIGYASKYSYHSILQSSFGLIAAVVCSVLFKIILLLNFTPEKKNYNKAVSVMDTLVMIMTILFSISSLMVLVKFL